MSDISDLAAFAGIMALGQFSPGPDMILLTRTALAGGARAGVMMALGIATGLTILTSIAVGGVAVAFEKSPRLHGIISWLAAAYLAWLAWKLLGAAFRAPQPAKDDDAVTPAAGRNPYLRGLLCNLLNPKAIIFLAAICADFLRGERPGWFPCAIIGVVVIQGGVLWALWARLLQWTPLRSRYERSARWIDGAFGVALIALALRLVLVR